MTYETIKLRERPELVPRAAKWFKHCFGVPEKVYMQSMIGMLSNSGLSVKPINPDEGRIIVPQWYIVRDGETIIAGMGVIENDSHDRPDLAPNVCAVYTDEPYRGQGIARELLETVCEDMAGLGIDTLYLVTDHTGLYERYGWEFLCMVNGNDGPERMYIHKYTLQE